AGKQFGRWRVIALHPKRTRGGQARWLCHCTCGREGIVLGRNLRSGASRSCGCIRKEMFALVAGPTNNTKHGLSRSRAYKCWEHMKSRCFNPRDESYPYYGGRKDHKITVCPRWLIFENFYADMGDPPRGMSIHRINNDLGYFPGNCVW